MAELKKADGRIAASSSLVAALCCGMSLTHPSATRLHSFSSSSVAPPLLLLLLLLLLLFSAAVAGAAASGGGGGGHNYKDALSKSLLYFEAQRSGRLPHNQRVSWRHHSGLTDGLEQGVDLVGGYYDAGDHVKFGLPMAFTVTMLAWGAAEFGGEVAAAGEAGHLLEAIKWGTDYFVKAHTEPDVLWAEVGDGDTDHYCWQRPEDMTTSRQAYKIDRKNPGSDLAGETAAAMAAASIAFRASSPQYAVLLLHHARQLFEFADAHRGKYDASVRAARSYYASVSGFHDELLWAAMWLHRATGEEKYLAYAAEKAEEFGGVGWAMTEFSWDVKFAGVQILAAKLAMEGKHRLYQGTLEQYKAKADYFVCACLGLNNGSNIERSIGGMLYVRQWNNLQYVSSAAFLLTVYSRYLSANLSHLDCPDGPASPADLLTLAKSQADYILGTNPARLSYMVGYGRRFPNKVHHRASSIVSFKENKGFIGCMQGFDDWFGRGRPNPNILAGAIVGGPDRNDRFHDDRGNYMQTEACTYNTAPMVGVLARLHNETVWQRRRAPQDCHLGFLHLAASCR